MLHDNVFILFLESYFLPSCKHVVHAISAVVLVVVVIPRDDHAFEGLSACLMVVMVVIILWTLRAQWLLLRTL